MPLTLYPVSLAEHCRQQHEGAAPGVAFEELRWALTMVQSRALRIASLGARALLPGIDSLNHAPNDPATLGVLGAGGGGGGTAFGPACASDAAVCMGAVGLVAGTGEDPRQGSIAFVTDVEARAGKQVCGQAGASPNQPVALHWQVRPGSIFGLPAQSADRAGQDVCIAEPCS